MRNFIKAANKQAALKKIFFLIFVTATLSGCVGMGSKFDCNVDSGGKCLPMDQINKMANAGAFNR